MCAGVDYSDIIDGIARTLWALAWADHEEAHGRSLSGVAIDIEAPETPENARESARTLAERIAAANGRRGFDGLAELWKGVAERAGANPEDCEESERFGYFLTMEALGHGVAWADDNPPHGLNVPDFEGGTVCDFWDYADGVPELEELCAGDCPDCDAPLCAPGHESGRPCGNRGSIPGASLPGPRGEKRSDAPDDGGCRVCGAWCGVPACDVCEGRKPCVRCVRIHGLTLCADFSPGDCAGPLEICEDGRPRCDPHADSFAAQSGEEER